MATIYKIHPAIGVARLGNSPDEFFIAPERVGERPQPAGGFKDAQCRVKRQAARFRIFAHHDDGTVEEIKAAEADIVWTVHLANAKAAYPGRGNSEAAADLTIDPGARTLNGPNQRAEFDTGVIRFAGAPETVVPLGEIRSDGDNHLLVLGGFGKSASPQGTGITTFWGNDDWYDDISDGPVSATITIRASGATPPVTAAWVICAPPKFAPHQDNVVTLYDRLLQAMVDATFINTPTTSTYTKDIYPILQRARDTRWVYDLSAYQSAHTWADPVTAPALRQFIFSQMRPAGTMPQLLNSDSALTPIQYGHLQRWKDDVGFTNDWAGPPALEANITPDGLDRAALEACVGGAFFPGIEAGGLDTNNRPILAAANYAEAFRLDHNVVSPGAISAAMALPWQADFYACGSNWWPVPRPNEVMAQGTNAYLDWTRDIGSYADMVAKWHTLGFVVAQGAQHIETERCDTPGITLLTPALNFIDIPQGPMGMVREQPLAITFEVVSPSAPVTLEYAPGGAPAHVQLVAANTTVTVGPTNGASSVMARLWVIYRTGAAPSAIPQQTIVVQEPTSGQTWSITIDANTVARKTAAVALVLDRSGSMAEDRGDGQTKHASLQQAAETFVDVMLEGDGVGLIRYDQDAQVVQQVMQLGPGGLADLARNNTIDLIRGNSFDPAGATSIGDGIYEGRQILNNTAVSYDVKSLAVLTDGVENTSRFIADVAGEINENTYAIGLGTPQNTSAPALQTISGNHGGYLLITGAIGADNRFLLQKYFLQILAGVSNAEVVLDPQGELTMGAVHAIPFQLSDADAGVDVILLSPYAHAVDFRLQTPNGFILEPWRAIYEPSMRYLANVGVSYYRLVLPAQLIPNRFDQGGVWHALLTIGKPRTERNRADLEGIDRSIVRNTQIRGLSAVQSRAAAGLHQPMRARPNLAEFAAHLDSVRVASAAPALAASDRRRGVIPYSLIVHAYSSVSLRASVRQSGYDPGARIDIDARVTQSGIDIAALSAVSADITRPDGALSTLDLNADQSGDFRATFVANQPGVHVIRVRARGRTRKGMPFTREQTLTAGVWAGGGRDVEIATGGGKRGDDDREQRLCELLRCLLREGGVIQPDFERRLEREGLDLARMRKCLEEACSATRRPQARG